MPLTRPHGRMLPEYQRAGTATSVLTRCHGQLCPRRVLTRKCRESSLRSLAHVRHFLRAVGHESRAALRLSCRGHTALVGMFDPEARQARLPAEAGTLRLLSRQLSENAAAVPLQGVARRAVEGSSRSCRWVADGMSNANRETLCLADDSVKKYVSRSGHTGCNPGWSSPCWPAPGARRRSEGKLVLITKVAVSILLPTLWVAEVVPVCWTTSSRLAGTPSRRWASGSGRSVWSSTQRSGPAGEGRIHLDGRLESEGCAAVALGCQEAASNRPWSSGIVERTGAS